MFDLGTVASGVVVDNVVAWLLMGDSLRNLVRMGFDDDLVSPSVLRIAFFGLKCLDGVSVFFSRSGVTFFLINCDSERSSSSNFDVSFGGGACGMVIGGVG